MSLLRNKRGDVSESPALDQIVYLVFVIIILLGMGITLWAQRNGSGVWGEYYAETIGSVVSGARVGDVYVLDVHRGTVIAGKSEVSADDIFHFEPQTVCVKLSKGKRQCYQYFNNVKLSDPRVRVGDKRNLLEFKVVAADSEEGGERRARLILP
jgi:hypothetical protein